MLPITRSVIGPWRGSPGPWSGIYFTVMEGGIRTPCLVRWPGRIPAGRVSSEIVRSRHPSHDRGGDWGRHRTEGPRAALFTQDRP